MRDELSNPGKRELAARVVVNNCDQILSGMRIGLRSAVSAFMRVEVGIEVKYLDRHHLAATLGKQPADQVYDLDSITPTDDWFERVQEVKKNELVGSGLPFT